MAGVLQRSVFEQQLGADGADSGPTCFEHPGQPVGRDHLGVVVQQQQVLPRRVRGTQVDDRREVEGVLVVDQAHLGTERLQGIRHRGRHLPSRDDDHLEVDVRGRQDGTDGVDDERARRAADGAGRADARHDRADQCHRGRRLAATDRARRYTRRAMLVIGTRLAFRRRSAFSASTWATRLVSWESRALRSSSCATRWASCARSCSASAASPMAASVVVHRARRSAGDSPVTMSRSAVAARRPGP